MNLGQRIIQKLILEECPNYDFDRYRFQPGDILKMSDGAIICVEYSALDYVSAFPLLRSMRVREKCWQKIYYSDLPYYQKGSFTSLDIIPINRLKWKVGDIVNMDKCDGKVLLTEEDDMRPQTFIGFVLECENNYYTHTGIYIENPMKDYFN